MPTSVHRKASTRHMASGAVVITLDGDPLVAVVTFAAAAQTGSSQRMSEGVHSVTDLMCDPRNRSMHLEGAHPNLVLHLIKQQWAKQFETISSERDL